MAAKKGSSNDLAPRGNLPSYPYEGLGGKAPKEPHRRAGPYQRGGASKAASAKRKGAMIDAAVRRGAIRED